MYRHLTIILSRNTICQSLVRWKSTFKRIDTILIANRGEIACRIIRTAKKMGIKTVALYSEADKNSLHVSMASEAFNIGPSPSSQSYLNSDMILEVAKKSDCQAIHPGYGFLSENVEFAENCQKEAIIFIGPPASAIRDMGVKSTSKHIMSKAGVPIIEGYHGDDQSVENLKEQARKIGFPVMIKAVRGGGGKGMRIAYTESDFEEALESAKTESQKAFSDSVVLLEKFVEEPRHVEVQVFADSYGNAVYLYERDCSVQRRHQKIIEEAPAPGISCDLRHEIGAAAVRAALAVGYLGAGTVEFILDRKTHKFHFMEMNTRLQVEHPITEMITGTDLVEWQIRVASGEKLPLKQEDIPLRGHAFEARIYAEDPQGGFLPGAGPLEYLRIPTTSDDVRIETGVRQGDEVSVFYDPMIAKLVVWGNDRLEALAKLNTKLVDYNIAGLETNVNFLLDLASHKEFQAGNVHTNFIIDHESTLFRQVVPSETQLIQGAIASVLLDQSEEDEQADLRNDPFNPFVLESNFRINYNHIREVVLKFDDKDYLIKIKFLNERGHFEVLCNGENLWKNVDASLQNVQEGGFTLLTSINGHRSRVNVFSNNTILAIFDNTGKIQFSLPTTSFSTDDDLDTRGGSSKAVAPMPGILDKLLVKVGDEVQKGDSLFVLIAMKMEYVVKATRDGKISSVPFKVGDNVLKDDTIILFEETEELS